MNRMYRILLWFKKFLSLELKGFDRGYDFAMTERWWGVTEDSILEHCGVAGKDFDRGVEQALRDYRAKSSQ